MTLPAEGPRSVPLRPDRAPIVAPSGGRAPLAGTILSSLHGCRRSRRGGSTSHHPESSALSFVEQGLPPFPSQGWACSGKPLDACGRTSAIKGGLCPSTPGSGLNPKKGCKNTPVVVVFGDNQGNRSCGGVYPPRYASLGAVSVAVRACTMK